MVKKSCSVPVVEFQQPAQALTGADLTRRFADSVRRSGEQNRIPLSLAVPFTVKVLGVIRSENARQPSCLIHDRDGAFFPLDAVLRPTGIKVILTPPQSPMCNAYAERFVRETRETLDNLILLGEGHFRHPLKRIEHHRNWQRPHRGLDNVIPPSFEYPDRGSVRQFDCARRDIEAAQQLG
jgi:transposase InsO family protein